MKKKIGEQQIKLDQDNQKLLYLGVLRKVCKCFYNDSFLPFFIINYNSNFFEFTVVDPRNNIKSALL
jgi:hypothetical protein